MASLTIRKLDEKTKMRLRLRAAWGEPEGSAPLVRAESVVEVSDLAAAEALGARVAAALREGGAHASAQEG